MSINTLSRPRYLRTNALWNRALSSPPIPEAVRTVPVCRLAIIVIAVTASSCGIATQESNDAISADRLSSSCDFQGGNIEGSNMIEREILALVNRERRSAGVGPLCFSRGLAQAAKEHNTKMATAGALEHRLDGEGCLLNRVTFAGVNANEVAENIFTGSQPASDAMAHQCVSMWMQSDGHRRNMLSPDFDKTGISVSYSARSGCYVTEDFARAVSAERRMAMTKDARSMRVSHHLRRPRRPTPTATGSGVVRVSASSRRMPARDPLDSMIIVEN